MAPQTDTLNYMDTTDEKLLLKKCHFVIIQEFMYHSRATEVMII